MLSIFCDIDTPSRTRLIMPQSDGAHDKELRCSNPMCRNTFRATEKTTRCPHCGFAKPLSRQSRKVAPARPPPPARPPHEPRHNLAVSEVARDPVPGPADIAQDNDAALAAKLQRQFDAEDREAREQSEAENRRAVLAREHQQSEPDRQATADRLRLEQDARAAAEEASLRLARELYEAEQSGAGAADPPSAAACPPARATAEEASLRLARELYEAERCVVGDAGLPNAAAAPPAASWVNSDGCLAPDRRRPQRISSIPLATQLQDEERRAKAALDVILATSLQNGTQFVDSDFPPSAKSLYLNGRAHGGRESRRHRGDIASWTDPVRSRHLSHHYLNRGQKWQIFNSPRPEDVSQGGLGNCWFLAALAAVVERVELIQKLFVTNEVNDAGV